MRNPPDSGLLADLSRAGIGDVSVENRFLRIGGAATFARVADEVRGLEAAAPLRNALQDAAAPALRNRITVGGSIALFPPWSSVVGPLVALGAVIDLVGDHEGPVPIVEYLDRRELRAGSAIVTVTVDLEPGWKCHWYRFSRTRFNYPLFTVTILSRAVAGTIEAARIVITGCSGRYRRCRDLEARIAGTRPPDELTAEDLGTHIPERQGFSSEYLTHRATVEVSRGLAAGLAEGERERTS